MLLKPLSIAAAGLAAANAFLLPPEISEAAADSANFLPFKAPQIAQSQDVKLDCPGCPFAFRTPHGRYRVKQGISNHLELSFNIDHQPDHDRLLVNGFELYPTVDPLTQVLNAPQVADFKDDENDDGHSRRPFHHLEPQSPQLGFTLQGRPETKDEEAQMDLISLDLQIIEVGNSFVNGIPNVHVKLIRTAAGGLMIGEIKMTESQTTQSNPMEKQEECTTILCKWRAIVADRIQKLGAHKCGKMGKAGKMGHHHVGDRPHHHHHQHHHHNHQGGRPHSFQFREHSWSQLFKKFGSHILFPVLIGIVAGVSVSIIGMMVGTIIIGLWRVFVRGQPFFHRRRHHTHHRSSRKEVAHVEEKTGLMDQQDLPPSYDEDENRS